MRALVPIIVGALVGCGGADPGEIAVDDGGDGAILCLNGAGGRDHPGNVVVDETCAALPGLVSDCADGACHPSFRFSDVDRAVAALREVAASGRPVSVLGYSWGGVNALEVARRLAEDDGARPIGLARVVIIDAFAPFLEGPLDVVDTVGALWSYRHSVAPVDDCSADRPIIGPYEGRAPRCARDAACVDYDWSLDAERAASVDHCTVTDVSAPAAVVNLVDGIDAGARVPLPPIVPVARRDDAPR